MKRGLKVLTSLVGLFVIGLPLFAQPSSKSITTFTMDDFDSVGAQNYICDGESLNWEWEVGETSRFIAEGFPKTAYTEGAPNSLKQLKKGTGKDLTVFGVNVAYNRKGDNWFEINPTRDGEKFEIPFIGHVDQLDFWVWGQNYNYSLEVLVRDTMGEVQVLKAGNLAFHGWKNVVVNIPGWIQQQSKLNNGPKHMTLVGFRVRTDPEEYVDNFTVWMDEIKYTTNSLSYIYDGYELSEFSFGESGSSSSSSSSSDDEYVEVSEK